MPVAIIYHADVSSTIAVLRTCTFAKEVIQLAACGPQKEITLTGDRVNHLGEELTVSFDEENQTITVLLRQKKKIDLVTRNPKLLIPIGNLIKGMNEKDPTVVVDPNDIQALCKYANSENHTSVIVPLILFDVTAKKVVDFGLRSTLNHTILYPDCCFGLTQVILHHSAQQNKTPEADAICGLLDNVVYHQSTDRNYFKPDPVPKLLSVLKANEPKVDEIVGLLETFIINDRPDLFEELQSKPNAKKINGEGGARLLLQAIVSKNPAYANAILRYPNLNDISDLRLAGVIVEALKYHNFRVVDELLSLPAINALTDNPRYFIISHSIKVNYNKPIDLLLSLPSTENFENYLGLLVKEAIEAGNIAILQTFLSHPNAKSISKAAFSELFASVFKVFALDYDDEDKGKNEGMKALILSHPTTEAILGPTCLADIKKALQDENPESLRAIFTSLIPMSITGKDIFEAYYPSYH